MKGAGESIEVPLMALEGEANGCVGVVGLVVELTTGLSLERTFKQRFFRLQCLHQNSCCSIPKRALHFFCSEFSLDGSATKCG